MADLALDNDGDLLIENGNLSIVRGADALRQQLQIRLRLFKGEWFLDTRVGMPYFQDILVKNPDLVAINGFFRQAIQETPGVVSIQSFNLDFDRSSRVLSLVFAVTTIDGQVLEFDREFIIQ